MAQAQDRQTAAVLVTGGHRGLGRELARQFALAGFPVIAAGRNRDGALPHVETLDLDLSDPASIASAGQRLARRPIDILIHNGAIRGATGGLDDVSPEDFRAVMEVNTLAPLLLTRALLGNLRAGTRRTVAMISSRAGSNSEGHIGNADGDYAYRCSKAALNMAVTKLAHDLKSDGIAVLAFHPGWVQTDMGGAEAPLSMAESAAGLVRQIASATLADTATFRTHDGQPVGW